MHKIAIIGVEWDVVDLIDSISKMEIAGFIDPIVQESDIPSLGGDEIWTALQARIPKLKAALAIDNPQLRAHLFSHYGEDGLITLISPHAHVSKRAAIGNGSLVQRGVTVMPRAQVGKGCKLNVNSTVHHDAVVGSFTTLAPGSLILGNVVIEKGVYVGAGAVIRQRCHIGVGAVIGAGAVVVKDVSPNATVVGVPAKQCKNREQ